MISLEGDEGGRKKETGRMIKFDEQRDSLSARETKRNKKKRSGKHELDRS